MKNNLHDFMRKHFIKKHFTYKFFLFVKYVTQNKEPWFNFFFIFIFIFLCFFKWANAWWVKMPNGKTWFVFVSTCMQTPHLVGLEEALFFSLFCFLKKKGWLTKSLRRWLYSKQDVHQSRNWRLFCRSGFLLSKSK